MNSDAQARNVEAMLKLASETGSKSAEVLARMMASNIFDEWNGFLNAESDRPNSDVHEALNGIFMGLGLMAGHAINCTSIKEAPEDILKKMLDSRLEVLKSMALMVLGANREWKEPEDD